ncbi:LysR substrate-binding domain-containing protein [Beijerinckia sp. L45]|uniref:LysR substrate-binding domain-containing protein n=1 Tax=Beijerinckia sp. L45 TaxID=1641855 RepID=UPI00131D420D|nr:LysR substrate-binding domain-containing protein [Beijerinckia sp. L45]
MNQINLSRVDLNLLVVFNAVAGSMSVTRAAENLFISQPAVSHSLNRLRLLLDDPLFVSGKGGLALTIRAMDLVQPVKEILASVERVIAPVSFDPLATTRTFRIGASEYAALTILPDLIGALHRGAPLASFEFLTIGSNILDQLAGGELDLTFWGTAAPKAPFRSTELFRETHVAVIDAGHALANKAKRAAVTLDEYLSFPHLRINYADTILSPTDLALAELGRKRNVAVATANLAGRALSLKGTSLIATLPRRVVESYENKALVTFPLPFKVTELAYYMVWHARGESDPASVWLRRMVFETTAGLRETNSSPSRRTR